MAQRYDEYLLLGYIEDDLSPEDRARFESLMEQDDEFRRLVAQIQADRDLLRALPDESVPSDLMDQINLRIERSMLLDAPVPELNPVGPARGFRIGRWVAYTGLAAMILLSTTFVVHTLVDRNLYDDTLVHDNPAAGRRQLAAADHKSGSQFAAAEADTVERLPASPDTPGRLEGKAEEQAFTDALSSRLDQPEALGGLSREQRLAIAKSKEQQGSTKLRLSDVEAPAVSQPPVETFARLSESASEANTEAEPPGQLARKVLQRLKKADVSLADEAATAIAPQPETPVAAEPTTQPTPPPPVLQVIVQTPTPEAAQDALLAWALEHRARIVSVGQKDTAFAGAKENPSDPASSPAGPTENVVAEHQITLMMPAGHLSKLIASLNQPLLQTAALAPPAPMWEGVLTPAPAQEYAPDNHEPADQTRNTPAPATPMLKTTAELDWGQLLWPYLPLQPTLPIYPPQTELELTVRIQKHVPPTP